MNETIYRAHDPITGAVYVFSARPGENHSQAWAAMWRVALNAR